MVRAVDSVDQDVLDEWRTPGGSVRFWVPTDDVFVVAVHGHFHRDIVPIYLEKSDAFIGKAHGAYMFADWSDMKRYDKENRVQLTSWVLRFRKQIRQVHLLIQSPVIEMGASLANLFLGGFLHIHSDSASFIERLKENIADVERRQSVSEFYDPQPTHMRLVTHDTPIMHHTPTPKHPV